MSKPPKHSPSPAQPHLCSSHWAPRQRAGSGAGTRCGTSQNFSFSIAFFSKIFSQSYLYICNLHREEAASRLRSYIFLMGTACISTYKSLLQTPEKHLPPLGADNRWMGTLGCWARPAVERTPVPHLQATPST